MVTFGTAHYKKVCWKNTAHQWRATAGSSCAQHGARCLVSPAAAAPPVRKAPRYFSSSTAAAHSIDGGACRPPAPALVPDCY